MLRVKNLSVCFHGEDQDVFAVQNLDLSLQRGETIGIVGESGCGKSTTAMALMGLLPASAEIAGGEAHWQQQPLLAANAPYPRELRGRHMGMIFQDP
jgi:ABC-type dipeptide/oligopeptide/nickel transport system ATPase component